MQLDVLNAPIPRQTTNDHAGGASAVLAASKLTRMTLVPLAGLALMVLVGVLGWFLVGQGFNGGQSSSGAASGRYGDPNRAYAECKHHVKDQLKLPMTALFPALPPVDINTAGKRYPVYGYVEVPNAAGVLERTDWLCVVTYNAAADMFTLESVTLQ